MFPWRAFLEDGGPFPVMSNVPNTLEYDMQMCLCGLSDRDRKVAHGELVGVQVLMEDVLLGSDHVTTEGSPGWQATLDKAQPHCSKQPGLLPSPLESHPKASTLLEGPRDAVMSLALLKSFLILWKQLEVLKEHWGRLRLQGQEINSASHHKQFSELYEADIFYPSLKSLARQMGEEDEFEGLIIRSQSILPPKGASEIEIKTQQLQKLLESLEIHMIQEVLKKVRREMSLLLSEKSKEEPTLPTDLWKHQVMKENFSVVRPQIVEKFVQRLMESSQDDGPEITFRRDHLEACLLSLGCDVMARERSNFETYSMCYEHVLQHAREKLSQREQEVDLLQRSQVPPEDCASQVAELSHDLIMEVTALRAQLTDLEEETRDLKNQIRKEVQEEYRELVQALFMTCLHIKEALDENQFNLIQKVCELIGEVRAEGIANVKQLKKTWGSARPDERTKENTGEESVHSQRECLRIKFMAEQEVGLLHQQLRAARQALAKAQTDNRKLWRQQDTQAQLLRELEHRVTQDSVTQQQLEIIRTSGMEKLLEDVEQKEQQLQLLTEEAQRASKLGQLQWKKMDRDLQQVRPVAAPPQGPMEPVEPEKPAGFPYFCSPGPHSRLSCSVSSRRTRKWFYITTPGQVLELHCSWLRIPVPL
ncbi:Coiled-coil domain-containing protein 162 [Lemmus lemmus]